MDNPTIGKGVMPINGPTERTQEERIATLEILYAAATACNKTMLDNMLAQNERITKLEQKAERQEREIQNYILGREKPTDADWTTVRVKRDAKGPSPQPPGTFEAALQAKQGPRCVHGLTFGIRCPSCEMGAKARKLGGVQTEAMIGKRDFTLDGALDLDGKPEERVRVSNRSRFRYTEPLPPGRPNASPMFYEIENQTHWDVELRVLKTPAGMRYFQPIGALPVHISVNGLGGFVIRET